MYSNPIGIVQKNATLQQQGLFSNGNYKADENIISFSAKEVLNTPNYLTVQVEENKHITLFPEYLEYINHSCSPNVFFNTTTLQLEALKNISIGDELTFFYPSTEWKMDQSFICSCGSQNCLHEIQGAFYISTEVLKKYKLTDFIVNKLAYKKFGKTA